MQFSGKECALQLDSPPSLQSALTIKEHHDMEPAEISRLIEAGFEASIVKVESDDNTHYSALIVAVEFDGKRLLARHQMVYKCLGTLVGNEIHALSITALTPDEWQEKSSGAPSLG